MSQTSQSFMSRWTPAEVMLAILFLVAPLYYHPNLGGEGLRIPNNATIWIVAVIFIAYSLNKVIKSAFFQLPRYFIYIAAFPFLVILSGFLAGVEQPLQWLFRVLFILGGFAFFFSLFQQNFRQGRWDRLLLIIALSGLIHAGIGLLQIWLQADMPYLLPKSPEGLPSGLFQQINNQATYLVTCIALAFYLASRPILFKRQRLLQLLIVVTVLAASFIVGFSGSRIGFLSLAVALPVLLFVRRKQLCSNKTLSAILLAALLVGFACGLMPSGGKAIEKTAAIQSGYSGSARLGIYDISLGLLKEEPLFGHGIGSFSSVFQYARPDFYAEHPKAKLPTKFVSHPHNELVFWMVEGGIVAVIGIVLAAAGIIIALLNAGLSRGGAYFSLLIPLVLHTQVELPMYVSALSWFLFLVLIATPFLQQLLQASNVMSVFASKASSISVVLISVLSVLLLLHTISANWDFERFFQGKQSGVPLKVATQNPYLSAEAQWVSMAALLNYSLESGSSEGVRHFVDWAEKALNTRPDVDLYQRLIRAYLFLNEHQAACATFVTARQLYPHHQALLNLESSCQK